jgi:hypothetical protein
MAVMCVSPTLTDPAILSQTRLMVTGPTLGTVIPRVPLNGRKEVAATADSPATMWRSEATTVPVVMLHQAISAITALSNHGSFPG